MSAYAWLHNVSPSIALDDLCRCGHAAKLHNHGKSCGALVDEAKFKYCKCEEFREVKSKNVEGETTVAKEKTKRVVKYEVTNKDGKELLAKDNTSQAAAMYRALTAAEKPLSIAECYAKCEGKMESGAAWERLGKNLNSTLFSLRKAGMVKRVEERIVIVKAAKPKTERKPRAAKPRTRTKKANGSAAAKPDVSDSDIPREAGAGV